MSLQEAKEVFGTLIFGSTLIAMTFVGLAYVIAKIRYVKAHKKSEQKQHRSVQNKTEIIYNLGDTSKMNLFEIKQAKEKLEKSLKGAM